MRRIWDVIANSFYRLVMEGGLELSGHMSFTTLFSLMPFLVVIVAVVGFLGDESSAQWVVNWMGELFPPYVAETLAPVAADVLTARRADALTIGLIASLWIASSSVEALRHGLNTAYGVREQRSFLFRRLQALGFVVGTGVIVFSVSFLLLALPAVADFVEGKLSTEFPSVRRLSELRYFFAFGFIFGVTIFLHHFLPYLRTKWRIVWPGALLSTVGSIVMIDLFSYYVKTSLANYSAIYGGLAGIIVTLLFFYVGTVIFLYGAFFNAALYRTFKGRNI
ncbi:YihY/virulence factor BrkB family protein [Alphaproteobacteria bacterium]|nr:YihY/virulence factor BrkB family protein [Alphaproteobacteria bacterium]